MTENSFSRLKNKTDMEEKNKVKVFIDGRFRVVDITQIQLVTDQEAKKIQDEEDSRNVDFSDVKRLLKARRIG